MKNIRNNFSALIMVLMLASFAPKIFSEIHQELSAAELEEACQQIEKEVDERIQSWPKEKQEEWQRRVEKFCELYDQDPFMAERYLLYEDPTDPRNNKLFFE
jgi:hypothetical protein